MLDIAKYMYLNYDFGNQLQYSHVLSLLDHYADNMFVLRDEEENIKGVAVYFKLSDKGLDRVKTFIYDLRTIKGIEDARKDTGNNIHIFAVVTSGVSNILKGVRGIIKKENPKTISWFSPDMVDFNLYNVKGVI